MIPIPVDPIFLLIVVAIIALIILALKGFGIKIKRRANVAVTAIFIIIGIFALLFIIDFFILKPIFGYESFLSYIFSTPIAYFSIIVFAITLVIGCFLPGRLGKIVRTLSYIALFVFLLFTELQIIKPFLKRTEVDLQACSNFFSPSQTTGNVVYDILAYSSCILSGYVPKDLSNIGWTTFFIFYIILPFTFIWVFVYALMNEVFSGWNEIKKFSSLLSFIVAMYGARVLFGAVLLEFFAYGAWGLAGIFIAIFLVKGLENLIEKRFAIEEYREELKNLIKNENELRRDFAESASPILANVEKIISSQILNQSSRDIVIRELDSIRKLPTWSYLLKSDQDYLDVLISSAIEAAKNLDNFELRKYLNTLKTLLDTWKSLR